ncbi:MAG: hypothetical protein FJZ60_03020, partial [Chlamydiae bacterium]|nr:hypothetical protein [Chlamydiota bacterium]
KTLIEWIEKQHHTLSKDEVILVQQRHFEAIEKGLDYLFAAKSALQENLGGELAVMDLKSGIQALSEIIGRNVTEEVLSQIFNHFCVGK